MGELSVQIYQSHVLVQAGEHLTDVRLDDDGDYAMYVETDGIADAVVVGRGCSLKVEGNGVVEGLTVRHDGSCSVFDDGVARDVELNGVVTLYNGGTLEDCVAGDGSRIMAFSGSRVFALTINDGAYLYGTSGGLFQSLVVEEGAKLDLTSAYLEDVRLSDGATISLKRCMLVNCTLADGFTGLSGKGSYAEENLFLEGRCEGMGTLDVSDATLVFCLDVRSPRQSSFLTVWPEEGLGRPAGCAAIVAERQASGNYVLVDDAQGFGQTLALALRGEESPMAEVAVGETATLALARHSLEQDAGILSVTVENRQLLRISRESLVMECDGGWENDQAPVVSIYARQADAALLRHVWYEESGTTLLPERIAVEEGPARVVAQGQEDVSLFLAESSEIWNPAYFARNVFTGDTVELQGKNRFRDVFVGSVGNAVLMLTDAADAFFADDIYSGFAVSTENRLQGISEIHAGAGDDIVDLTCTNVAVGSDGCLLDGGAGDDILWGGRQAAVLCGGAGDDTLVSHRDGALFVFGKNWGHDTVQVGDGLDYRLCFARDAQVDVRYNDFGALVSCGDDTVAIQGVFTGMEEKLLFGADAGAAYSGFSGASLAVCLGMPQGQG